MTAAKATGYRPIASALAAMSMLALAAFMVIQKGPAQASHNTGAFIDIFESSTPRTANQGQEALFDVGLVDSAGAAVTATIRTLILMEIEGTPNDSDLNSGPNSDGHSHGTPDGFCAINAGEGTCQVKYTFPIITTIPTNPEKLRFWINGHTIDYASPAGGGTGEGVAEATTAGCVTPEPDHTELIDVVVIGATPGGTPPAHIPPVAGADANPKTCDNTTPAPSVSGTDSGTPTPTDSGTPTSSGTPTPTDSGTPTSSGSPTPSQSPTGGGATVSMSGSPTVGVFGTDFVISGEVRCQGLLVPNATVQIFRRYVGSGTFRTTEAQTDVQGRYAYRDTDLPNSSFYSGAWGGNPSCPSGADTGNTSVRVDVRVGVTLNARDVTLRRGETAVMSGRVIPNHPGTKVWLQMYSGNPQRWRYVAEARLNSQGNYTLFYRNTGSGFLLFRIAWPTQHIDHAWNVSRNLRIDWA